MLIHGKGYAELGDGELRVSGCYCLLPPSKHPDGPLYKWSNPPNCQIPFVADLKAAGLAQCWTCNTEDTVDTEGKENSRGLKTLRGERVKLGRASNCKRISNYKRQRRTHPPY